MAVYLPEWQVQRLVKLVTLLCARLCRPCKVQTSSRKLIKVLREVMLCYPANSPNAMLWCGCAGCGKVV